MFAALLTVGACLSALTSGCAKTTDDADEPSVTPSTAGERYAAFWEKSSGSAYVARHRLTSQQYQDEFEKLASQGYCLTSISGYAVGSEPMYAAIWEQTSCPSLFARHGLTSAQYQQEFDRLAADGYRLKLVNGYTVGGQDRYAAIWDKTSGPAFVARHALTSQQYQQEFDTQTGQGYCLSEISGYSVDGEARYAAIWEQSSCANFVARHGLTSAEYQQEFDRLTAAGYRTKVVNGYRVAGQIQYAALWEKASGPAFVARHDMTSAAYQSEFDELVGKGFRPKRVSGF